MPYAAIGGSGGVEVMSDADDGPDDESVADDDDGQRKEPGADEIGQDKDASGPVIGQVVETATRQVTLRDIFSHPHQGQPGKGGRVGPDDEASDQCPAPRRLPVQFERSTDDEIPWAIKGRDYDWTSIAGRTSNTTGQ